MCRAIGIAGPSGALAEKIDVKIRLDEIQANRFASAFLISSDLANPKYSAEHLSELFDVNLRVAEIRKEQLEKLLRRATGQPRALPPGVFDFLRDARKKGFDVRSLDREISRQRSAAKANGYEDIECRQCGYFTVRRKNSRLKCETCGSKSATHNRVNGEPDGDKLLDHKAFRQLGGEKGRVKSRNVNPLHPIRCLG